MIAQARPLRLPVSSFKAVFILGLALGIPGLGAAAVLCQSVLIPLASACLQACARDPMLMHLARGAAALAVAIIASGLAAGLLVMGNQIRSTRRLVHRLESRASTPPRRLVRLAAQLGVGGRLTYVLDAAPYGFCYGFLSPRICLSSGMARTLTRRELRAVLLHEVSHLHHRDPLKVLISRTMAGALFLLPVAAELRDRYLLDKELSADAEVVERLSPRPLAGAILKICRSAAHRPVSELAAAAVGPFSVVGERIRHLTEPAHRRAPLGRWKIVASLAAVAVVLVTSVGSGYAAERSAPAGGSCCAGSASCILPGGGLGQPQ